MTYCVAVSVNDGLVFCSDSRTNAGVDQVAAYSKMHLFGVPGERQLVILSAGNLATTQAVVARMRTDSIRGAPTNLMTVDGIGPAAEYLGQILREESEKHGQAVTAAGFSPEASFIIGGQIGQRSPKVYMVYPQGNFITSSAQTPYLQIGETKYGKPVLDRFITPSTSLDAVARCALVSMDSTLRSNASVGPPVELLRYDTNSLFINYHRVFNDDDPYFLELSREWGERLTAAFNALPPIVWSADDVAAAASNSDTL